MVETTWLPNEPYNFLCFAPAAINLSGMDHFTSLDSALFAQDPTASFAPLLEETMTPPSTSSQLDIPLDEDRSGSGYISGLCVIS